MNPRHLETIRAGCRPLSPRGTQVEPHLREQPNVRAVLFDIYGTLIISASGDIGVTAPDSKEEAYTGACSAMNIAPSCSAAEAIQGLEETIQDHHAASRASGVAYPEVEIAEIWRTAFEKCGQPPLNRERAEQFSVEFEVRVNPTWPMPGVEECLANCENHGMVMGIVSNAQFFTPLLFPALLGKSLNQLGCLPSLTYLSYEHGTAKPGTLLFEQARGQLEGLGIRAGEVLYVGNDMLNDIAAAAAVGFLTGLFAGDQRSLRWRSGDSRVKDIEPDVVLTALNQLMYCLAP